MMHPAAREYLVRYWHARNAMGPLIVALLILAVSELSYGQDSPDTVQLRNNLAALTLNEHQQQSAMELVDKCALATSGAVRIDGSVVQFCKTISSGIFVGDFFKILDGGSSAESLTMIGVADKLSRQPIAIIQDHLSLRRDQDEESENADSESSSGVQTKNVSAFSSAGGSTEEQSGKFHQENNTGRSGILAFGVDIEVSENTYIGGGVGFTSNTTRIPSTTNTLTADGASISAFGSWSKGSVGYVDLIFDTNKIEHEIKRSLDVSGIVPGSEQSAVRGSPTSTTHTLTFRFGRNVKFEQWRVGLYSTIAFAEIDADDYVEVPLDAFLGITSAHSVRFDKVRSQTMTSGVRISRIYTTRHGRLMPRISYEVVSENTNPRYTIRTDNTFSGSKAVYVSSPDDPTYRNLALGISFLAGDHIGAYMRYRKKIHRSGRNYEYGTFGVRYFF